MNTGLSIMLLVLQIARRPRHIRHEYVRYDLGVWRDHAFPSLIQWGKLFERFKSPLPQATVAALVPVLVLHQTYYRIVFCIGIHKTWQANLPALISVFSCSALLNRGSLIWSPEGSPFTYLAVVCTRYPLVHEHLCTAANDAMIPRVHW